MFDPLVLILGALLGAINGSFLNMLCYRLPIMTGWAEGPPYLNLFLPRSHCPHCKTPLKLRHNIPIFSFLFLKGRCAFCQNCIDTQYLAIELLSMLLGVALACFYHLTPLALVFSIPVTLALAIAIIDYRMLHIPDELNYCLLWSGLLVNASFPQPIVPLTEALWGAVIGYVTLWSLYHAYKAFRRKEGLGYGDFKLFAAWGAWFGALALPILMLTAATSALAFVLYIRLKKGSIDWQQPVAFGPWLAFAGLIQIFILLTQQ